MYRVASHRVVTEIMASAFDAAAAKIIFFTNNRRKLKLMAGYLIPLAGRAALPRPRRAASPAIYAMISSYRDTPVHLRRVMPCRLCRWR